MPRYFFHVYDDDVTIDEEGAELRDLDAAHAHAVASARSLICDGISRGHLNLAHRIEVADAGDARLTVAYRDAVTIEG